MKNIYLHIIGIVFMITFSVESFAQACNLLEGQIIASPVYVYDASADSMIITVPVKNAGNAAFASPFKITVYKDIIDNGKTYRMKKGIEVVADRKTLLPGGIVWYELSFNTLNITWQ